VRNLIKLEQNYRSHGNILDAANHLISNNAHRLGKNLRTDAGHGEPVRVFEASTDAQEAGWIVEEIRSLINTGMSRSEIAVLYRSNAQSRAIEHTLLTSGIPYRVYGGLRFFERQEVKHALAYLRLIDNPNDDTAFVRVVNFPTRGIGARSIEQLADAARLYDCSMAAAIPYVTGKAGTSLGAFATLIAKMRAETEQMSLPETVEYVVRASGLADFYQGEREGQDRLENLQELVNAATAFVSEEGYGLDAPARAIPLRAGAIARRRCARRRRSVGRRTRSGAARRPRAEPRHDDAAGGLPVARVAGSRRQPGAGRPGRRATDDRACVQGAFSAVFITGLEEGLFPHENSVLESDGLEEERRLMYVAITRAKERLYLSFAQSRMLHGQTRYNVRSRFFDELPERAEVAHAESGSRFALGRPRRQRRLGARLVRAAGRRPSRADRRCGRVRAAAGVRRQAARGRHRVPHRPAGVSYEIRRGCGHRARRQRRRCKGAGEVQAARREVARARGRETAGGGMMGIDMVDTLAARPLGILAALPEELGDLIAAMRADGEMKTVTLGRRDYHVGTVHGAACVVTLARVGKVAAAATVSALIHVFGVSGVVFTGVAGGVSRTVRVGDVVVADTLLQHDLDASPLFPRYEVPLLGITHFATDVELTARLKAACALFVAEEGARFGERFGLAGATLHGGLIISGDRFVSSEPEVVALRDALPDALAVEMEGAAIAQVCAEHDVPFALVRTISDTADDHATQSFSHFLSAIASSYSSGILKRFLTLHATTAA
jgi:5'-methylthioadenosine/S-adenosylhomocysteine nucleosidase